MSESDSESIVPQQPVTSAGDMPAEAVLPGATLARHREAHGWTMLEVADQLNLAARQIAALEADNYAALPAIAVVRGFIRAYAKLLKIDSVGLLAGMPANPSASLTEPNRHHTIAHTQFSDSRLSAAGYGKNGSKWYSVVVLLLAIIGGAALAQHFDLLPGDLQSIATKMKSRLGLSAADAPASTADNAGAASTTSPTTPASADVVINSSEADKTVALSVAAPTIDASFSAAPAAPVAEAPLALNAATTLSKASTASTANDLSNQLVLNLRDDSWIEIRGTHTTVASKLYRAGATEVFDITEPVQLIVGNAAGVDATLRGAPLVLQTSAKNNVARLNLK